MIALDEESSLGNVQMLYRLYDEEDNELTGTGEIERVAYGQFMQ